MINIIKTTASGSWSGEVYESFETVKEASEYLVELCEKRDRQGYNVDIEIKGKRAWKAEIQHDNQADVSWYEIDENTARYCTEHESWEEK